MLFKSDITEYFKHMFQGFNIYPRKEEGERKLGFFLRVKITIYIKWMTFSLFRCF